MLPKCETCGSQNRSLFKVWVQDEEHTFDTFSCAITALAPQCKNCGTRVLGHAIELHDQLFCSAPCAEAAAEKQHIDRYT